MTGLRQILLAEDDAEDVELTLEALASHNLANAVVVVRDGAEALDYLHYQGQFRLRERGDPALVLLDIKMPKIDGLDVLRRIKTDPQLRTIPVVLLTSSREEQDLIRGYDLGANAYVVKPVDFAEFVAAIKTLGVFWALINGRHLAGTSPERRAMKILLLDDDPNDVELVRAVLEQEGLADDLTVTHDLKEFRAALDETSFDAILSDYRLPQGDGLEALREVRARDPEIPMIIVSGTLGEEQAIDTVKLGATDYVLKQRLSRLGPALRRAQAEQEERRRRRRAEELRDRFYSLSRDLFAIAGSDQRIYDVNSAWERTLGWNRGEMLGRIGSELVHPEDRERSDAAVESMDQGEATYQLENRCRTKTGDWRWIQWTTAFDPLDQRIYAVGRDITELKKVQIELAERARRQSSLADLGRDALRRTDLDGLFERAARLVADTCCADLVGIFELQAGDREFLLRAGVGWSAGRVGHERMRADADALAGYTLEVDEPVIVPSWENERRFKMTPLLVAHGVSSGMAVAIGGRKRPFGVLGAHSRRLREFSRDDANFLQTVANLIAEAVERRHYEDALRSTEDQLRQSQKMEALGLLAAGVAHDFNNILTAILGYAELASEETDRAKTARYLQGVRDAANRAANLSRQLLGFSRKQVRAPRVFDLNSVPRELEPMLRRVIGEDVELRLELSGDPLHVEADPSQIEQVVLNLAVNARDAMPEGGVLSLETRRASPDPARIVGGEIARGRTYACLIVRDTGTGMDASTLAQAFEPFFTTKAAGRGTGLGLSIVEGIARQSGGLMSVETAPGQGSAFEVFLPEVVRAPLPAEGSVPRLQRGGNGESVLVVDDDPALRRIVRQVLEKHGYQVAEAADPAEARRATEHRAGPFDLLLSDLVLKSGSGAELSSALAATGGVRRTLLMSGFMSHPIAERWLTQPGDNLLPKPFSQEQLLRAVREALGDTEPGSTAN